MTLKLFWTDQCFLGVLLFCCLLLLRVRHKAHIKAALKQVFQRPMALSAALILALFLLIGVLDSIHFETESHHQFESILDRALAPIGQVYEKTYSAPLALSVYSAETVVINGHTEQVYPRLKYPPSRFQNPQVVGQFVTQVLIKSIALSAGLIGMFYLLLLMWQRITKGTWRLLPTQVEISGFITMFFLLFLVIATYWISRNLHVFGTGKIGEDVFYYTIKSIRTGLVIGTITTLFMMPVALLLGISAGYFGGVIDDIIQYIYTTLSSIPGVLLITASVLSMQTYIANHPQNFTTLAKTADARLLALCLILGVTSWTSLCRILRAEALKLREIDFVLAARALGSSSMRIIFKHLLPNVMHIVVITLVLDFSFLVLAEAVLSYVGVGVSPLTISWGNMINAARLELAREPLVWWPVTAAFIFMFSLVLAGNLFADAVRDAFDPRHASR